MTPAPIQRGIIEPQAAPASGLSIVFRGVVVDGTLINPVNVPAGALLMVYLIMFSDGSLIPDSSATADGVPLANSGFLDGWMDSSRTVLTQVYTAFYAGGLDGGEIELFNSEPGIQSLSGYAFSVEGGPPTIHFSASGDDSQDTPRPGPCDCPIVVPAGNSILLLADFQLNGLVTGDAYTTGGALLRADHLIGGVDTGMMSFGVFDSPTAGAKHIGRDLHNPPRPYFGHAMAFGP